MTVMSELLRVKEGDDEVGEQEDGDRENGDGSQVHRVTSALRRP